MSPLDILDLRRLRVFYEVAKAGSFSAACDVLDLTQPSISRQIIDLETDLEAKLFFRHSRGIELTAQGKILYQFADRMFQEAQVVRKLLADELYEMKGELRIATTPALGSTWLMSYLPGFLALYPNIHMAIIGHFNPCDLSRSDVLIRPYMPDQPELIQRYLKGFKMGLYASPRYLSQYGAPQSLADLDHHRLIALGSHENESSPGSRWILQAGVKPPARRTPYLQVNSAEGLVNAAQADLGIIELAEDYYNLKGGNLVPVLPEWEGPSVDIYYIYPAKLKDAKKITALCEYLEHSLAESSLGMHSQEKAQTSFVSPLP